MTAAPSDPDASARVRLRLYVAGESSNSLAALTRLRAVLADCPQRQVELEIIDVLQDPERGLRDRVIVAPMLVRLLPAPERRVLGNLHDRQVLLTVLGLDELGR